VYEPCRNSLLHLEATTATLLSPVEGCRGRVTLKLLGLEELSTRLC
jgi:hypothetical protein